MFIGAILEGKLLVQGTKICSKSDVYLSFDEHLERIQNFSVI